MQEKLVRMLDHLTEFEGDHAVWVSEGRTLLEQLPERAEAHLMRSLFHYFCEEPGQALRWIERCRELPHTSGVDRLELAILADYGEEDDFLSRLKEVCDRQNFDLVDLQNELKEAGLPIECKTLLQNSFPNPTGWVLSYLETKLHAESESRKEDAELYRYEVNSEEIPKSFRELASLAEYWGIGDDAVRASLLAEAHEERLQELRGLRKSPMLDEINQWLDSFGEDFSPSASSFLYLLTALEEVEQ